MSVEQETRGSKRTLLEFFILYALQYDSEFHYLHFPPEMEPALRSVGEFYFRRMDQVVVPPSRSYILNLGPVRD